MASLGREYSWANVRCKFLSPLGLVRFSGRANGSPLTVAFQNEETSTYTIVDGNGVHIGMTDTESGIVTTPLQATSDSDTLIEAIAQIQRVSRLKVKGTLTVTDLVGTGIMATLTDCCLSNQPGVEFGEEQPERAWIWKGKLSIVKSPIVPVFFGLTLPAPP
jgi:hypothetical protein